MQKQTLLSFLGLLTSLTVTAVAQVTPPSPPKPPINQPAWTEHYRKATVSFGQILAKDGKPVFNPIGTGVLVCTDAQHAFIVTAKHVFYQPEKKWFPAALAVRFSSQETQSLSEQLGVPIQLANEKQEVYWSSLEDGSDIASIAAPPTMGGLLTDCIGFQDFATEDDVFDGATVFTFGFPTSGGVVAGPNSLVRAITRSGIIAWTDPNGVLDNPIVLDSNVMPGNSGGPAFRVPSGLNKYGTMVIGGRVAFLGVVVSGLEVPVQIGDQPLRVLEPGALFPTPANVVGVGALGRVEPASKVRKLVQSIRDSQK